MQLSIFQEILGHTEVPISPCSISQLQELLPFRCSESQAFELQNPISDMEIMNTLFAMPLNKCPDPKDTRWNSLGLLEHCWKLLCV